MARPVVFNFTGASSNAIALTQSVAAHANVVFNGSLPVANNYVVDFPGVSRTISLTSTDDLSGVNFTITGTYRGIVQSEVLVGPNNATVYSANLYDTITSIVPDAPATNLSAGTGTTGKTHWYLSDYHTVGANLTITVAVTGTINYTFLTTLDDVQTIITPTTFTPATPIFVGGTMSAATTSEISTYLGAARYSCIQVNSSTTGSLIATFLQQGIK